MGARREEPAVRAARAHTNLTVFEIIVIILEGGCLYGSERSRRLAAKIIRLCKAEQQACLREFDAACAEAREPQS